MIVFEFKTKTEFNKAEDLLKKAIDSIGTSYFDHSYQPDEKTITVEEKKAPIVEGWFKKHNLKYTLDRGFGRYASISSVLRRVSVIMEGYPADMKNIDTVVKSTPFIELMSTTVNLNGQQKTWDWVRRVNDTKVVVICASYKNKLVIIKEYRAPLKGYEYGFPAGLMDEGESPEETAVRELKEETGLDVDKIYAVSPLIYSSAGLTNESVHIVICTCSGSLSKSLNENDEDITTFLKTPEEVKQLLQDKDVMLGAKAWLMMTAFVNENSA